MKIILYSIYLLLVATTLSSQVEGYIIDRNNQEVPIIVKIPWTHYNTFNEVKFQKKPKQIVNGKNQIISPNEVLELGFYFEGRPYTYRPIPKFGRLQFKKLILDGEVSVFEEFQAQTNQTSISYIPLRSSYDNVRYLICQEGENAFYPTTWNFKKRMIKKLRKCPEFEVYLNSKPFDLEDVLELVEAYNEICH